MADKELPYKLLKKVMATSTAADYGQLSLAVLQKASDLAVATRREQLRIGHGQRRRRTVLYRIYELPWSTGARAGHEVSQDRAQPRSRR